MRETDGGRPVPSSRDAGVVILSLYSREARDGQPRSYVSLLCSPLLPSGEASCGHPLHPSREARGGHPLSYRFLSASYRLSSLIYREAFSLLRGRQGAATISLVIIFSSLLTVLLEGSYRLFFLLPCASTTKRKRGRTRRQEKKTG